MDSELFYTNTSPLNAKGASFKIIVIDNKYKTAKHVKTMKKY